MKIDNYAIKCVEKNSPVHISSKKKKKRKNERNVDETFEFPGRIDEWAMAYVTCWQNHVL
jgi:hypothetical protein